MSQKIIGVILCLLMVPFLQGCDESDVIAGTAIGAVVGGAVVAATTDNYYGDPYYRLRYGRYYRYRHGRYVRRYGHRYGRRHVRPGYGHRRGHRGHIGRGRGHHRRHHLIQPATFTPNQAVSQRVVKFADFYQMPIESAQVIWNAQKRALGGDVQGLADIGFFAKDLENLVQMKSPSKETLYRMSLRTGLDEDHVADILTDFQQEYMASKKAGRL